MQVFQEPTNGATDREIRSRGIIAHSPGVVFEQPINDAFLGVFPPTPKSLIMSCRVFYDLRHVSHDAPSVCPAVTEGPASSHSCRTAPSLTSACRHLHIKTMLWQSELVCPSPWVEPCHYFSQTQEKKIWFSTCYRKCNIGMSSKAAGTVMFGIYRCLAIFLGFQSVVWLWGQQKRHETSICLVNVSLEISTVVYSFL